MSRQHRVHTFARADLAMADAYGLEVKALCGRWVALDPDLDHPGDGDRIGTADDGCMRCAASVRRLIRESGVQQ